jgi:hypothetical protein
VALGAFLAFACLYGLFLSFDWGAYVAGSACYTILAFGFARVDRHSGVFFMGDFRPISVALLAHLIIVALLVALIWSGAHFRSKFPLWLLNIDRKGDSWLSLLMLAAVLTVLTFEVKWLSKGNLEITNGK